MMKYLITFLVILVNSVLDTFIICYILGVPPTIKAFLAVFMTVGVLTAINLEAMVRRVLE